MRTETIATRAHIDDLEIEVDDSIIGSRKTVKINGRNFKVGSSDEIKELGMFLISAAYDQ